MRLLGSDAMWAAFAPRLRELNLTVNSMEDLDLIFHLLGIIWHCLDSKFYVLHT